MMTLEQYLQVAKMWYAEQNEEFNPFNDGSMDFMDEEEENRRQGPEYKIADDGWVDYADGVNTIPDKQKTEVQFDQDAFNQSQIDMANLAAAGQQPVVMNQSSFVIPN